MIEYGGGVSHGPAGQVGGGGNGTPSLGTETDLFGTVGAFVNDAANFLGAQPPEVLVAGFLAVLLGLVILKRAF
ncbi:MAG TPA: hypothetical protein VNL94_07755 [Candidatus Binatia bacterium]|nr:hypothetical protein [Candidatus Binatia bacterium]